MRTLTAMKPFTAPIPAPTANVIATPAAKPKLPTASATTSDDSAATEPTDRSISAAPSANAIPTAITAIGAAWRPMFSRFEAVTNPSSRSTTANSPKMSAAAA